ncbi:Concanavalin A-like lectin/glucanases superfamily protein [Rubritalea squalenifaciens DSM 18772]|uniref:Concanavalin A-like lectin/glucanases superfamily protein n=1 Tax=Rubritalea squalenifaciens DSM 18772 TaxID=1123071 RepID=A0A1M6DPL3_9BACT|nr:metallophosphoesterase [Rubritalea squalenifaciens]SHI75103.1 Concanavalin A-like lectin/glucanases superfamily protein [Rubritalea squalenifaciens DSM 18772]
MKRLCFIYLTSVLTAWAHNAPSPLMHWDCQKKFLKDGELVAQKGFNLKINSPLPEQKVAGIPSLGNPGKEAWIASQKVSKLQMPELALTVSSWISVDKAIPTGGIVGYFQDNGNSESGWVLGYDKEHFSIGLASAGNQRMTYLQGKTKYQTGKLYHVAATYDGSELRLYVNGKLDASSKDQTGAIRYPDQARLALAGYVDSNENFPHTGTIREVYIYDLCATDEGIAHEFDHGKSMTKESLKPTLAFEHEAPPFLQMATQNSIGVNWATTLPSTGTLFWGETAECKNTIPVTELDKFHHMTITGLQPDTQYFYRTESISQSGNVLKTNVSTFETAPEADSPIAFAIISDTQGNPKVAHKMATYAWAQRPDFLVIPGDLTSTGTDHTHWTEHFFPSMDVLIKRVPMYPVLGNHERNAHWYYDYMNLPDPEYYYTFHYGPAQFFMIDSNKKCTPGSEQYEWLEKELKKSQAKWKMIVHHHPVYSSDANDYGDLWKTNKSSRGDMNVRAMSKLYDQYGVDVVFNGHIHSYERTWQVKEGKVVQRGGIQYFVTGGGGGPLEEAGPSRPKFQNTVKKGHHYAMVRINGDVFEFQAYDEQGKLFDSLRYTRQQK